MSIIDVKSRHQPLSKDWNNSDISIFKNYFYDKIRSDAKSILITILVDFNRFKNVEVKKDKDLYIAYIGSMEGDKDGIEILLLSFAMISSKLNNYKLYLIGGASLARMNFLKSYVEKLNISRRVCFLGKVNVEKVPELLSNASMLTLARPDNLQAKEGFPTKLGEYLATGKPVVITTVGDIPLYIKDGYNAFLAKPDSVESFAKKMKYVLTHYKEAQKVGYNGRELAKNTFNYSSYKKELLEFINSLLKY